MYEFEKRISAIIGIFICFIISSLCEEALYSYIAPNGKRFSSPLFYLFILSFTNCIIAVFGMLVFDRSNRRPSIVQSLAVGFSYLSAMYFANESLKHLSYPMQILGKSCKLIPVVMLEYIARGRKYGVRETVYVILITVGINLFIRGGETEPSSYGLVLLFLSLVLDGVTTASQEQMQKAHMLTTHELMFFVNLSAVVFTFFLTIISGEGSSGVQFCQENTSIVPLIQIAAIASTLGQNFIFFTISNLDSLTLTAITTSRKLFTIFLSVFTFGHKIAPMQWAGVALVFSGLFYEWHTGADGMMHTS